MKFFPLILFMLLATLSQSQTTTSRIEIYKLYSEGGGYYLKSIPFDNEEESIFGKTYVFKVGQDSPLYTIDRHFNYTGNPNKIHLSNNGQTIFYINDLYGDDKVEEKKNITVYSKGKLIKSYTGSELIGCNGSKRECHLLYKNKEVINRDSTKWENHQVVLGYNEGTTDIERFANSSNVFSHNDTIYLLDHFKQLRIFDLPTGVLLNSTDYELNYLRLTKIFRTNSIELKTMESPSGYDLPLLANGMKVNEALAAHLDMATTDFFDHEDDKYKRYKVVVNALIDRSGKLEINELEVYDGLPEEEIRKFLTAQAFDMKGIPEVFEKWRFNEYLYFRNKSKSKAIEERRQEIIEEREAYLKRLSQDSINGFFIPQNLGECFVQLDTLLKQKDREEMKALANRDDMIRYHHGLGTYLRNNWGLWGGSRLQKYFTDRGIRHPDDMSAMILEYYHDWLNGKTETWKEWEKKHVISRE